MGCKIVRICPQLVKGEQTGDVRVYFDGWTAVFRLI